MDFELPEASHQRILRLSIYSALAALAVIGIVVGLAHLQPAAPVIDKSSIWTDEVKFGDLTRTVHGAGTLAAVDTRWIPAESAGRVNRILLQPGDRVHPETVLMELTNPELQQQVLDAESQLQAALADYADLKAQLNADLLKQKAALNTTRSQFKQAKLQSDVDEQFRQEGLGSELKAKLSKGQVEQFSIQLQAGEESLKSSSDSMRARLATAQTKVDQQRRMYATKQRNAAALQVRAGTEGVLQQVSAEAGQQVGAGSNLARVANPARLEAELRISELLAKDVMVGQTVSIDTHNGLVAGRITRIDPSATNGTVLVNAAIEGTLPNGARMDLGIDGMIEIEKLHSVLYLARPAGVVGSGVATLFKLAGDGASATRVNVKIGRNSAEAVEITAGLKAGDKVILSDTSAWSRFERIRLK